MKKRRDYQNVNLCIRYENFNLSCHDPCHLLSFSNLDPSAYASDSDRHAEKSSGSAESFLLPRKNPQRTVTTSKSLKYSSVHMIQSLQRIFKAKKSNNIEFPSIESGDK